MKDMRRFYEAWEILDANSVVATVELEESNSAVMTAELLSADNEIDIFHTMQVSNVTEFPVEDFFKVPFTHHSIIIGGTKDVRERYYYIHRTAEEHLGIRKLRQLIKEDVYKSQGYMPSNFTRTINDPIEARRAVEMFKSIGIVLCQTANHSYAQYAVRDYTKPMGVATYKTLDDMPEKLRKALPDVNKMIEILKKKG